MMAVGASSLLGWSWGGGLFVTGVWEAQPVASSYSLPKFSLFVRFPPPPPPNCRAAAAAAAGVPLLNEVS